MSKKGILIVIILVLAGLVSLAYFYRNNLLELYLTRVISKGIAGNVKVEDGGKKVTYKGADGDFSFQQGDTLPANFPAGFPVYPGAKVTSSWTAKGETGDGISAIWETSADPSVVALFYKTELVKAGWQMSSSFEQSSSYNYSFSKDNVTGIVGITKSGETTTISVAIGNK
jgi:hypothetical protein